VAKEAQNRKANELRNTVQSAE